MEALQLQSPHSNSDDASDDQDTSNSHSIDDRVLLPRYNSLENSLIQNAETSYPSPDEMVIRQRGRKKFPVLNWSPVKSPFKTPTKRNSLSHFALLSPSPAKKLFNNSSPMILRSSPRKRNFDCSGNNTEPSTTSTPFTTPTKRLRFDEKALSSKNPNLPLKTLLKGLSNTQLIEIISDITKCNPDCETKIRSNLPLPDLRPMEEQLNVLRKNITKSCPRSRLMSKTDSCAYSRASLHLLSFKKAIHLHCKTLYDSNHWDALIDYVMIAWYYVRALPMWDEVQHNNLKKECFKYLTVQAASALKYGNRDLGIQRLTKLHTKLKSMVCDHEDCIKLIVETEQLLA